MRVVGMADPTGLERPPHLSGHRRGRPQRLMDTAKVVMHVVQRDREGVIFEFL